MSYSALITAIEKLYRLMPVFDAEPGESPEPIFTDWIGNPLIQWHTGVDPP